MIIYPSLKDIIETNKRLLADIKIKRADKHEVLARTKIEKAIKVTKEIKGDIYDKASELLKQLIQAHPFASGNRRTAFIVSENFLISNGRASSVGDNFEAYILQGIRENYYTNKDIKNWLIYGKIHRFKR